MMYDLYFPRQDAGFAAALGNLMFVLSVSWPGSLVLLRRKEVDRDEKTLHVSGRVNHLWFTDPLYLLVNLALKTQRDTSSKWVPPNYLYLNNFAEV
jgi:hypothetical protein